MSDVNRVRFGSTALGMAYTALGMFAVAGFGAAMARWLM